MPVSTGLRHLYDSYHHNHIEMHHGYRKRYINSPTQKQINMILGGSACNADPYSQESINEQADRYVMSHFGCGRRHKNAFIEGAKYILALIGKSYGKRETKEVQRG
jgi:hypothetical protein